MFTCPINYDFEECSACEHDGNSCGNCEHTKELTADELRILLDFALHRVKLLSRIYKELSEAVLDIKNKMAINK